MYLFRECGVEIAVVEVRSGIDSICSNVEDPGVVFALFESNTGSNLGHPVGFSILSRIFTTASSSNHTMAGLQIPPHDGSITQWVFSFFTTITFTAAPFCQCNCIATPSVHNAPRECAIRMPRDKAANTGARGPVTPDTGPGQVSTRFCNLAEALFTTGATFGNKVAKSVCSFCVL